MKVLVIGGGSMIGSKIVEQFIKKNIDVEYTYLKNNIPVINGNQLDITQKEDAMKLISKINPDIVIHASALTNVDLCETNRSLAYSINVDGTSNIIEGCNMIKCRLVYISTSFVFNGKKHQYSEEDQTTPSTYYGFTKLKGEELVKQSNLQHLILRTDQPFCWIEKWQHTNSVIRVIETLRANKKLKEISDWFNTPTYVPDFINALYKLLERKYDGTYHVVGSDYISRYELAILVTDIFGLDKKMIESVTSDSLNLPVRRANVNLSNNKLFDMTGMRMMGIHEGLEDMHKSENM
jgi:dTDP-4-dehydrorhamnose reductase